MVEKKSRTHAETPFLLHGHAFIPTETKEYFTHREFSRPFYASRHLTQRTLHIASVLHPSKMTLGFRRTPACTCKCKKMRHNERQKSQVNYPKIQNVVLKLQQELRARYRTSDSNVHTISTELFTNHKLIRKLVSSEKNVSGGL